MTKKDLLEKTTYLITEITENLHPNWETCHTCKPTIVKAKNLVLTGVKHPTKVTVKQLRNIMEKLSKILRQYRAFFK
jgi:hypothetical protein